MAIAAASFVSQAGVAAGEGGAMFNRELGNMSDSGEYIDYKTAWQLDGRLPFAYRSYHDDEVGATRWEGGDLVLSIYSEEYPDANEERIVFVDAQVVHEDGWFDAPQVIWLYNDLTILDGGYEVSITGIYLADDPEKQPPVDREVGITLRARDIRVVVDGKVIPPSPKQLPEYLLVFALNVNAPEGRQTEARRRILSQPNFDYSCLVHPFLRRSCWEGCADVLGELGDETLQPLLPGLLEWLIDLDWPGARRVFDRLSRMRPELLRPAREAAIRRAGAEDGGWLENLSRLPQ